jgi:hypothetical protein
VRYPNLDYSAELTESEAHVAAVWPLESGDVVTFHANECPAYEGDGCACSPIRVSGPTSFA